jgi:hypothetical protein
MFYCDKTFVFNPTSVAANVLKKNVRDTLDWMNVILGYFKVKSVTLILYGNIWQYFEDLVPLAKLVYYQNATIYVNKRSLNQILGLQGTPAPRNRVNIVIHDGHAGGYAALFLALVYGNLVRQNNLDSGHPQALFGQQTERLKTLHRTLPREFPRTRTTSFRLPRLPGNPPGPPNSLPGSSSTLPGFPYVPNGLSNALAGLPGLPSALASLPGFLNAPPALTDPSNELGVYLGPGDIIYSSYQAASLEIRSHSWDHWMNMSEGRIGFGPFASERRWVTGALIPTLAYYHHKLWAETRRIQTYQANNPTISPNHPLPMPMLSTLGDHVGFGSWRFTTPLSSVSHRLACLCEERIILRRFLAIMIPYGVGQPRLPRRFHLGIDGITRV